MTRNNLVQKRQNHAKGILAEQAAALMLRAKGYTILATRYKTPHGEIDLITKRTTMLVFVEVKARKSGDDAVLAVTPQNQKRVADAARVYLSQNPLEGDFDIRFDVVAIAPYTLPRHIENAWDTNGYLGDI